MRASPILLLMMLLLTINCGQMFKKVAHNIDPQAKCLDGSPAAIFLHEGDPRNILLYFMGGGSCAGDSYSSTLQNCYKRSKTMYGSSKQWPDQLQGGGILSTDPKINFMSNWTKVFIIYCDGAFHQGYAKDSYKYKDTELFFRGAKNTRAHIKYIDDKFELFRAKKVVLSGSSAGGIATYIWADFLADILNPMTEFYSVPDSSIFLDPKAINVNNVFTNQQSTDLKDQVFFNIANKDQTLPNEQCVAVHPNDPWNCFDIQSALPHLETTSLFLQSSYDQYIINNFMHFNCLQQGVSGYSLASCNTQQMGIIEYYRDFYLKYIDDEIIPKGHSIWTISCCWHAGAYIDGFYQSDLEKVPMVSGYTMNDAVRDFVIENSKVKKVDTDPWPGNAPCAK